MKKIVEVKEGDEKPVITFFTLDSLNCSSRHNFSSRSSRKSRRRKMSPGAKRIKLENVKNNNKKKRTEASEREEEHERRRM
jgi:hypothetical protein